MFVKKYMFKGHMMFGLFENADDQKPVLSFGMRKAQLIVDNTDVIGEFVDDPGAFAMDEMIEITATHTDPSHLQNDYGLCVNPCDACDRLISEGRIKVGFAGYSGMGEGGS